MAHFGNSVCFLMVGIFSSQVFVFFYLRVGSRPRLLEFLVIIIVIIIIILILINHIKVKLFGFVVFFLPKKTVVKKYKLIIIINN